MAAAAKEFRISIDFADDYSATPMKKAIKESNEAEYPKNPEFWNEAGFLEASLYTVSDFDNKEGLRDRAMDLGRHWVLFINRFYVLCNIYSFSVLAKKGEMEVFKGKGKWMICKLLSDVIETTNARLDDIMIALDASGGECRYKVYPSYSDINIDSFFEKNYPEFWEKYDLRSNTDLQKRELYCKTLDEMRLVEYYKSYELVPMDYRYIKLDPPVINSPLWVPMYGKAENVVKRCGPDSTDPTMVPQVTYAAIPHFQKDFHVTLEFDRRADSYVVQETKGLTNHAGDIRGVFFNKVDYVRDYGNPVAVMRKYVLRITEFSLHVYDLHSSFSRVDRAALAREIEVHEKARRWMLCKIVSDAAGTNLVEPDQLLVDCAVQRINNVDYFNWMAENSRVSAEEMKNALKRKIVRFDDSDMQYKYHNLVLGEKIVKNMMRLGFGEVFTEPNGTIRVYGYAEEILKNCMASETRDTPVVITPYFAEPKSKMKRTKPPF